MHPGPDDNVAVGWRSPIKGQVKVKARVAHAQSGGNGIEWWIVRETKTEREDIWPMARRTEAGRRRFPPRPTRRNLGEVAVEPGDMISLVVGPKGTHHCDTTLIELVITEVGGRGRVWNLTEDVVGTLHGGQSPRRWPGPCRRMAFLCRESTPAPVIPSEPPFALASQAASAAEFIKELKARKLSTIRQQTRAHEEQTWEGAVTAMRGANLPPHPKPPAGSEPPMQVQVPSRTADGPMEPGGLASPSALRKEPEERPAVVQRLSLRHSRPPRPT